jgi:hypothetical protein
MECLIGKKEKDGVQYRKQGEGWSSKQETSISMECLIESKEKDGLPYRKQVERWSA